MHSTMLYTIGTALGRARDHGVTVRVLVAGQWIDGSVSDLDGQGVVIAAGHAQHSVVRIQDISAVQVNSEGPLGEPHDRERPAHAAGPAPSARPPHPYPEDVVETTTLPARTLRVPVH